jgi:hypothetical protein
VSGANGTSFSSIQYIKSLIFSIPQSLIPQSAIQNRKRLHSLPRVVIFPDAFVHTGAAELWYLIMATFKLYNGIYPGGFVVL